MQLDAYTKEWFTRADKDIGAVRVFLNNKAESDPNIACFHAQQSCEKYLKGFLLCHGRHVKKIHQLDKLLADCIEVNQEFSTLLSEVIFLNQFYVSTRYPGDYPEGFSWKDVEQALAFAEKVRVFVLKLVA